MVGEQIGQYQLKEIIGQGGMATVYKAYHPATDRLVAVKVLTRQLSEDPAFLKRFRREARVVARLEHRSILPIYDYGEHDGQPYIVMRMVEAGTLRTGIYHGQLDLPTAARIVEQVAEALDYAHSHGVIHRDLKPSNILLDEHNNAYLTDFGIAKMLGSTSQVTASGVVGTPSYMSPEQCQGKSVTSASDIYALAAILHEIVTGRPPFVADRPLTVMYMHVREPVPSVLDVDPSLPPAIDEVIERGLAKQPEMRYMTASALAEDFRHAVAGHDRPVVRVEAVPDDAPQVGVSPVEAATPVGEGTQAEAFVPESVSYVPIEEPYAGEEPRRERWGLPSGVGTFIMVALGLAFLLGAVGLGLLVISWFGSGGGSALVPTLPPSPTVGLPIVGGPTATPLIGATRTPEGTPSGGIIIEPSDETPTPTQPSPSSQPTDVPPTATSAPPTATTPPPTATDTPEPTATAPTATPTPTLTSTPPLTGGSGWLAFTQGSGESAEIAVIDANGQNPSVVTDNDYYDGEPDWSPDGTRLAFESTKAGNRDIYVMSASGENVQQLTDSAESERHPDWSPGGGKIAYEKGDQESSEIYVMNADGSSKTRLTENGFGDRAPQFSPDGTQIAYMTESRGKWEIAIMTYPGGEVTQIFDCPADHCRFPAWSPDGSKIAFNTMDEAGNIGDVYVLTVSTGQSTLLAQEGQNGRPVWSGDGVYIFLNRTIGSNTDLYRVEMATGVAERLTTGAVTDYGPDWGPE